MFVPGLSVIIPPCSKEEDFVIPKQTLTPFSSGPTISSTYRHQEALTICKISWAPWVLTQNFSMQGLQTFCEERLVFRKVWPWSFWTEGNSSYAHVPPEEAWWCREGAMTVTVTQWWSVFWYFKWLPLYWKAAEQVRESEASDGSFLLNVKSLSSQVAYSSTVHSVLQNRVTLVRLCSHGHRLPTGWESTVVKMEKEAQDFPEYPAAVGLSRSWCCYMSTWPLAECTYAKDLLKVNCMPESVLWTLHLFIS